MTHDGIPVYLAGCTVRSGKYAQDLEMDYQRMVWNLPFKGRVPVLSASSVPSTIVSNPRLLASRAALDVFKHIGHVS